MPPRAGAGEAGEGPVFPPSRGPASASPTLLPTGHHLAHPAQPLCPPSGPFSIRGQREGRTPGHAQRPVWGGEAWCRGTVGSGGPPSRRRASSACVPRPGTGCSQYAWNRSLRPLSFPQASLGDPPGPLPRLQGRCHVSVPSDALSVGEDLPGKGVLFSRSVVSDSATPWTVARQASLSFIISSSLPNSCPLSQ